MALFNNLKNRVDGLVHDAKEKVTAVTGVDADKLVEAAGDFRHAAQDAAGGFSAVHAGRVRAEEPSGQGAPEAQGTTAAGAGAPGAQTEG